MDYHILNILKQDSEWVEVISRESESLREIIDSVVNQELEWANYLFNGSRKVVGLSASLLQDYTLFMAKPLYDVLGLEYTFKVVEKTPLPYMEKYIDSSKVQVAAQELNITAYKLGAIEDDTENLVEDDLDFKL